MHSFVCPVKCNSQLSFSLDDLKILAKFGNIEGIRFDHYVMISSRVALYSHVGNKCQDGRMLNGKCLLANRRRLWKKKKLIYVVGVR